ncbi:MAG: ion transporter [Verrucomicrobiia bacterium]|jgi:voltage-gated potassium channel|tara:strand:+ start:2505 stop:3344 length:840 start_codon:yes stop_codon:yes gene_type:complete
MADSDTPKQNLRERVRIIIHEADTPAGKAFDVALIVAILGSVAVVMMLTVPSLDSWHDSLYTVEWGFTILFTLEYALRLWSVNAPAKYARSYFGVIDLVAILPTYISAIFPGANYLLVVRALRVLRIFRILKLIEYVRGARTMMRALRASFAKIMVFLLAIVILATIIGAVMYLVEGQPGTKFESIPQSIYWAIVTLTTVGYGDITPATPLGQFLAAVVMIMGYSIIAVPTGIVSAEMVKADGPDAPNTRACPNCGVEDHRTDAVHCHACGETLHAGDV